jgi:hypothetical protein
VDTAREYRVLLIAPVGERRGEARGHESVRRTEGCSEEWKLASGGLAGILYIYIYIYIARRTGGLWRSLVSAPVRGRQEERQVGGESRQEEKVGRR